MIGELFQRLSDALSNSAGAALAAAFVWGVLSIILSPCHLASIPLVVAVVGGSRDVKVRRAFVLATLFSLGILVTIAAVGAITAAAGRVAGDVGGWAYYVVAAIFLLVGLYLLDVVPLPLAGPSNLSVGRKGPSAALLMGLVFGVAVGPCTFAYMAPVLGLTFKVAADQPVFAVSLLLLYGLGHCSVIVAAGSAGGVVQRYLNWNARSGAVIWLRRACGVLVILGGLWLLYTAP